MSLAARVAVTYRPRHGLLTLQVWGPGRTSLLAASRDAQARGQRRVPAHRVSPDEYAPSYHVVLDDGAVVAVRSDQVRS